MDPIVLPMLHVYCYDRSYIIFPITYVVYHVMSYHMIYCIVDYFRLFTVYVILDTWT